MGELRKTPLAIAVFLLVLSVAVDLGGARVIAEFIPSGDGPLAAIEAELAEMDEDQAESLRSEVEGLRPDSGNPGIALPTLAMLDGLLLLTVALMALGKLSGDRISGMVHGPATFLVSLILVIVAIVVLIVSIALLLQMLALLLAPPFGTLAYLGLFGFFARGAASIALSVSMGLKLGAAVALVVAQPKILASKGLILITATALVAGVLTNFLHGFVPIVLVSVTDAVAAILVCILTLIWSVVLLIGSIPSIVKALTP